MSTLSPIKFVYFDVGGVLLTFYHTLSLLPDRWGIDQDSYRAFMKSVEHARASGAMTEAEVEQRLIAQFGDRVPRNYWARGQFVELFQPITAIHELVYALENKYRLGLLTNVTETVWLRGQHDFPQLYPQVHWDQVVASYAVKTAKPDKQIYEIAIQRTGLQPAEICFVDDMPENLETAQQLGMQTIQSYPAEIQRTVTQARQLLLS